MNIQREATISTLDELCELMCGGVEDDEELSFEEWWDGIDDTEREDYNRIMEEINKC